MSRRRIFAEHQFRRLRDFAMKRKLPMRLRVMHFIGSLRVGGAEKVVSSIAREAKENKQIVYVLAFSSGSLVDEFKRNGIEIVIRPFRWQSLPVWLFHVVNDIRKRKIDVLHTHLFTTDLLGRIVGSLAGVPVVICTLHAPSTWKRSERFKNKVKKKIDKIGANSFTDGIIAISEEVKKYQAEIGGIKPGKMRIISNPVRMEDFACSLETQVSAKESLGYDKEDIVITNVGSLKPIKGQEYLLNAIALLTGKHPKLRLMLIGDGQSRQFLEEVAVKLDLEKIVKFMGIREDIATLLCASDIYAVASLSEGISISILEAMAAKVPVVATAVGGNTDLIEHCKSGLLVKPQDAKDLAQAINTVIVKPMMAKRLGDNAFEFVKNRHDISIVYRQIDSFYRELLEKKLKGHFQ